MGCCSSASEKNEEVPFVIGGPDHSTFKHVGGHQPGKQIPEEYRTMPDGSPLSASLEGAHNAGNAITGGKPALFPKGVYEEREPLVEENPHEGAREEREEKALEEVEDPIEGNALAAKVQQEEEEEKEEEEKGKEEGMEEEVREGDAKGGDLVTNETPPKADVDVLPEDVSPTTNGEAEVADEVTREDVENKDTETAKPSPAEEESPSPRGEQEPTTANEAETGHQTEEEGGEEKKPGEEKEEEEQLEGQEELHSYTPPEAQPEETLETPHLLNDDDNDQPAEEEGQAVQAKAEHAEEEQEEDADESTPAETLENGESNTGSLGYEG